MADMFTRTIDTYKATAYNIAWKDGKPVANKLGEAVFSGANTKTVARAALKAAGVDCPRGTEITVEKIGSKKYGCTVDEFMSIAHEIEE